MRGVAREEITSGGETVEILIEVDDDTGTWERDVPRDERMLSGTRGPLSFDVGDTTPTGVEKLFSKGMRLIRSCAEQVSEAVQEVSGAARPQAVEVKFGVKLSGETGALIAKTGTAAHMEVTLKWAEKKE